MDYSERDLATVEADLLDAERRHDWMSSVATALKSQNRPARVAERQQAHFAQMAQAMRELRTKIETAIVAERDGALTDQALDA